MSADDSPERVMLVYIDLSILPMTAEISAASLTLTTCPAPGCTSGATISFYELQERWTEDATWNRSSPGSEWSGGAGAAGISRASTPFATWTAPESSGTAYQIDVTSAVADWVANPEQNFGFVAELNAGTGSGVDVQSSETTQGPSLTIQYRLR